MSFFILRNIFGEPISKDTENINFKKDTKFARLIAPNEYEKISFDDFVISYFVTGNGVNNISILVYTMSKRVNPSINALSTLIVVLITAVLILINVVPIIKERREKRRAAAVALEENGSE